MRNIEFGRAIRKRRLERSLKVFQLAEQISVDPVYITQIEKHGKLPSPAVMERISAVLCDRNLLTSYLEIKYPLLYEERKKLYPELSPEMEEIFKEIRKKNKTPEEQRKLEKRVADFHAVFSKDKEELQKTIRILEMIERLTLSLKKRAKKEGKSKEFREQVKAVEKAYRRKF